MSQLFSKSHATNNPQTGLVVTFDELLEQQKYLPYLLFNSNVITNRSGNVRSAFKGRGMEFEEVRKYIYGDDIRDIDWRVTARKLEPYTKVFSEEKDRQVSVLLDLSATMIFGTKIELKSVTACRMAALLGWLALHNKDRFGLLIYDGRDMKYYKPENHPNFLLTIMNEIAKASVRVLNNSYIGNISHAMELLEYQQKGRGIIFILSDFYNYDEEKSQKLAALSRHNEVFCINIFDKIENSAPLEGVYAAQYEYQKVIFNCDNINFKKTYEKYFADNRDKLKNNCRKFLCRYIEVRTDIPIFKQLSFA